MIQFVQHIHLLEDLVASQQNNFKNDGDNAKAGDSCANKDMFCLKAKPALDCKKVIVKKATGAFSSIAFLPVYLTDISIHQCLHIFSANLDHHIFLELLLVRCSLFLCMMHLFV